MDLWAWFGSLLAALGVLRAAGWLLETAGARSLTVMAQFARPASDVTVASWSPTPLWQQIDEATASDADLIGGNNNTNDSCEVALSAVSAPDTGTRTVRYRYRKDASGGNARNLQVHLYQGGTLIQSGTLHSGIGNTFTAGSFVVTAAISDYSDLRLRFTASGTTGGSGGNRRSVQVSWAELEVPDAPSEPPPEGTLEVRDIGRYGTDDVASSQIVASNGGAQAGELVIAYIVRDGGTVAPTPPDGTWVQRGSWDLASQVAEVVWTKFLDEAPPATWTFTVNNPEAMLNLLAVSGEGTPTFDALANAGASSTSLQAPSTAFDDTDPAAVIRLWSLRVGNNTGRSLAEPGDVTVIVDDFDDFDGSGQWILRSIGWATDDTTPTGTSTATASHSHAWRSTTIAVRDVGGGGEEHSGTAAIAGTAATAAAGAKTAARAASIDGSAQIDSAASRAATHGALLDGSASLSTAYETSRSGQILLEGDAAIAADGAAGRSSASSVAGAAAIATTGTAEEIETATGSAAIVGSAELTTEAAASRASTAELAGAAELTTETAAARSSSSDLTGQADLVTEAAASRASSSSIAGDAQVTTTGQRVEAGGGTADLQGAAAIATTAETARGGAADLQGAAELDAATATTRAATSTIAGDAQTSSTGTTAEHAAGAALLEGAAELTTTGQAARAGAAAIAGAAELTVDVDQARAAAASIAGELELVTTADVVIPGSGQADAVLAGAAAIATTAQTSRAGTAAIAGDAAIVSDVPDDPPIPHPARTTAAAGPPPLQVPGKRTTTVPGRPPYQVNPRGVYTP